MFRLLRLLPLLLLLLLPKLLSLLLHLLLPLILLPPQHVRFRNTSVVGGCPERLTILIRRLEMHV